MNPNVRPLGARPWCLGLGVAIVLACASAGTVTAQMTRGENSIRSGRPRRTDALDYITIDVRGKPLREVLQGIGRQVDVNIVSDPQVSETVTVELDSVEWRMALVTPPSTTNPSQASPRSWSASWGRFA